MSKTKAVDTNDHSSITGFTQSPITAQIIIVDTDENRRRIVKIIAEDEGKTEEQIRLELGF